MDYAVVITFHIKYYKWNYGNLQHVRQNIFTEVIKDTDAENKWNLCLLKPHTDDFSLYTWPVSTCTADYLELVLLDRSTRHYACSNFSSVVRRENVPAAEVMSGNFVTALKEEKKVLACFSASLSSIENWHADCG